MLAHLLVILISTPFGASDLVVAPDSVFAVVTKKAGVAKGLAHNHFVYAGDYKVELTATPDNLEDISLDMTLAVDQLVIDDYQVSSKWYPKIRALGILDEAFSEQSAKTIAKVRKAMLGKKQLNVQKYANIKTHLERVETRSTMVNGEEFTHVLFVTITIHGVPKKAELAARLAWEGDEFKMVVMGDLNFSDFGIEPYSAMFGAISNEDRFYIYVHLTAR